VEEQAAGRGVAGGLGGRGRGEEFVHLALGALTEIQQGG